jgi:hypothetical protein
MLNDHKESNHGLEMQDPDKTKYAVYDSEDYLVGSKREKTLKLPTMANHSAKNKKGTKI